MKDRLLKLYPWAALLLIYVLIFAQYPLGITISRLVLHKDILVSMQPSLLLLWGMVRIGIILPLIYSLVSRQSLEAHDIYLRFGNFQQVLRVTFWATFAFSLLGFVLYPWFLKTSNLTLLLFLEYTPIFLVYAITNAFVEETFFRGIGLTMLSKKYGSILANIIQAICFAAIHMTNTIAGNVWLFVVITLVLGLLWGYLTQRYRSLFPAVVLHVVADIFLAVSLF